MSNLNEIVAPNLETVILEPKVTKVPLAELEGDARRAFSIIPKELREQMKEEDFISSFLAKQEAKGKVKKNGRKMKDKHLQILAHARALGEKKVAKNLENLHKSYSFLNAPENRKSMIKICKKIDYPFKKLSLCWNSDLKKKKKKDKKKDK